jgi:hypothetical protein
MPKAFYREPAVREEVPFYPEPAEVPDSKRHWFIRHGDSQDGPFAAHVIVRSQRAGVLRGSSLVRAEDETQWRQLGSVRALRPRPPVAQCTARTRKAALPRSYRATAVSGNSSQRDLGSIFLAVFLSDLVMLLVVRGCALLR